MRAITHTRGAHYASGARALRMHSRIIRLATASSPSASPPFILPPYSSRIARAITFVSLPFHSAAISCFIARWQPTNPIRFNRRRIPRLWEARGAVGLRICTSAIFHFGRKKVHFRGIEEIFLRRGNIGERCYNNKFYVNLWRLIIEYCILINPAMEVISF